MEHLDFVHIVESNVAAATDTQGGYRYILIAYLGGFVLLVPAKSRTTTSTAGDLVRWYASFGAPRAVGKR